jgi:polysaccharide biosynthesis protein PelA
VPSQPERALSSEDRAAAQRLLQLPTVRPGHLRSGATDIRAYRTSITHVQSMAAGGGAGDVYAPTADDLTYLDLATELYPYGQVVQTLELTDRPRRLKPIAIHYHAFAAGSHGGINTLETIYSWVLAQDVYPVYVDEYQARVCAFRQQVLARHLDGSFSFHGGGALRTVRVPAELGLPDLAASSGVSAVRMLPQGCYVSFAADQPRHLVLGQKRLERPHVVQANAAVLSFKAGQPSNGGSQIQLRITGHVPLTVELGGLTANTHCRLVSNSSSVAADADRSGLLKLALTATDTGEGILRCTDQKEGS